MSNPTTELVVRLREHADRDNCVSHDWGGALFDAGQDCSDAADALERLTSELALAQAVLATRNVNLALLAEERDAERTKRQQAEHERDHAIEDVAKLAVAIERIAADCPMSAGTRTRLRKLIAPADDVGGQRG